MEEQIRRKNEEEAAESERLEAERISKEEERMRELREALLGGEEESAPEDVREVPSTGWHTEKSEQERGNEDHD